MIDIRGENWNQILNFFVDFDSKISDFGIIFFILNSKNFDFDFFGL